MVAAAAHAVLVVVVHMALVFLVVMAAVLMVMVMMAVLMLVVMVVMAVLVVVLAVVVVVAAVAVVVVMAVFVLVLPGVGGVGGPGLADQLGDQVALAVHNRDDLLAGQAGPVGRDDGGGGVFLLQQLDCGGDLGLRALPVRLKIRQEAWLTWSS